MADNDQIDEIALNTLLADGVDAPTAYAASIRDAEREPHPAVTHGYLGWNIGLLVGVALFVLWLLW